MNLAARIRTAKADSPSRLMREHLKGKLLEFQRTGRTSIMTRDQNGNVELKTLANTKNLILTLNDISKASDEVFVCAKDGRDLRFGYTIGDVIHNFRVGGTVVDIVTNVEQTDGTQMDSAGVNGFGIKSDMTLTLEIIGLFADELQRGIDLLAEPLATAGITDDDKLHIVAFEEIVGNLLSGRAIERGVTEVELIKQLGPVAFTTHPVFSVLEIFHRSRRDHRMIEAMLQLLEIKNESELTRLDPNTIRAALGILTNVCLDSIGCPPVNVLVTNKEAEQIRREIFE